MKKVFEQKLNTLRSEKQLLVKKRKLQQFLLQKGYEADLVREMCRAVK